MYKKLVLNNIDKILHFLMCFFLLTIFATFLPPVIAGATTLFIGVIKEIIDTKFSWLDILADILGIVIALLIRI